jgi:hypothetical protein
MCTRNQRTVGWVMTGCEPGTMARVEPGCRQACILPHLHLALAHIWWLLALLPLGCMY